MDDDRIFGCLPGETPTSIVLFQQERRHREALAAAQSRIAQIEPLVEAARIAVIRFNNAAVIHDEMLLSAMSDLQHAWGLAAVEKAMGGGE